MVYSILSGNTSATLQFPTVSNNSAAEVRMETEEAFILRRVLPWVGQCTAPQVLL